jgi:hypothetical protein
MFDSIRKGNEYRREKYGKPDTFAESWAKAQAWREWYKENCVPKMCKMTVKEIDLYKEQYQYWECWTTGRFQTVENPNPTDRTVKRTCRSNPVTGFWEEK